MENTRRQRVYEFSMQLLNVFGCGHSSKFLVVWIVLFISSGFVGFDIANNRAKAESYINLEGIELQTDIVPNIVDTADDIVFSEAFISSAAASPTRVVDEAEPTETQVDLSIDELLASQVNEGTTSNDLAENAIVEIEVKVDKPLENTVEITATEQEPEVNSESTNAVVIETIEESDVAVVEVTESVTTIAEKELEEISDVAVTGMDDVIEDTVEIAQQEDSSTNENTLDGSTTEIETTTPELPVVASTQIEPTGNGAEQLIVENNQVPTSVQVIEEAEIIVQNNVDTGSSNTTEEAATDKDKDIQESEETSLLGKLVDLFTSDEEEVEEKTTTSTTVAQETKEPAIEPSAALNPEDEALVATVEPVSSTNSAIAQSVNVEEFNTVEPIENSVTKETELPATEPVEVAPSVDPDEMVAIEEPKVESVEAPESQEVISTEPSTVSTTLIVGDILTEETAVETNAELTLKIVDTLRTDASPVTSAQNQNINEDEIILNWAIAWSSGNIEAYLDFYHSSFTPSKENVTREQWEKQRRKRLTNKQIRIIVSNAEVYKVQDKITEVRFTQRYTSTSYKDKIIKAIEMIETPAGWKFISERTVKTLPFN